MWQKPSTSGWKRPKGCRLIGLALAFTLALNLASAWAQQAVTVNGVDFAKAAIAKGDYPLARKVLGALLGQKPDDIEINFLLGETDLLDDKLDAAIERFRTLLAAHPDLVRVRLDYALALFRAHQDDSAEYNFYLALDASLPEQVRANVMSYLYAIRARRRYEFSVAASVAADTNINTGIGQNEITLFGLPFTPGETLQRKSGVGLIVALGGEYRYPLTDTLRWRSDASLWRAEYPGGQFDDMVFRTQVGPQWLLPDWDLSALGVYTQRWYGNDPFDAGAGPRVEVAYHGFERWRLEGDAEYLDLGFHTETFENGRYLDVNFYPDYYLPPTAYLRPILGYIHQDTASAAFSDDGYRLGLGYNQELPLGITADLQGETYFIDYDGANALFGTTRRDTMLRLTGSVYRRDFIVFGLSPVFTIIFTRNASNQALFAYRRYQFQIGLTKAF